MQYVRVKNESTLIQFFGESKRVDGKVLQKHLISLFTMADGHFCITFRLFNFTFFRLLIDKPIGKFQITFLNRKIACI